MGRMSDCPDAFEFVSIMIAFLIIDTGVFAGNEFCVFSDFKAAIFQKLLYGSKIFVKQHRIDDKLQFHPVFKLDVKLIRNMRFDVSGFVIDDLETGRIKIFFIVDNADAVDFSRQVQAILFSVKVE